MNNPRKSELAGIVEFECRIIHKQLWELVFKVAQYVIGSKWVEDYTLCVSLRLRCDSERAGD